MTPGATGLWSVAPLLQFGDTMTTEQWMLTALFPAIAALAAAVGILFRHLIRQQRQFEAVLRESAACFATVAELIRQSNLIFVEVKNTMLLCKRKDNE